MTIEELELFRGETGVSESIAYLNNARVSPYPRPTLEVLQQSLDREFREGWTDQQACRGIVNLAQE